MKIVTLKYLIAVNLMIFMLMMGCSKEEADNPFDPFNKGEEIEDPFTFDDSTNFAALHHFIFQTTCANSGCHDGTFEPDFRTISSSYNTLLYQPVIKNDQNGTYTYRVVPGNVEQSQLYTRMTTDIDGFSGIMPLETDPDSDWETKKEKYKGFIKSWIEKGAPDMFGNPAESVDLKPQLGGFIAFANGSSNPLPRNSSGTIQVPAGTNQLDLWFAFIDDNTNPLNFSHNKVQFSLSTDFVDQPDDNNLQISSNPVSHSGYNVSQISYTHQITISPFNNWSTGNRIFVRTFVSDGVNDVTEIPSDGAAGYIKNYFSFRLLD
ncbi:MAG: hypothetical protein EA412_02565 [Chitinophagaceae bacterium]|nr:MAG: hypothetical protein EA412_02565 [Chitinophagaceae bacterium]